MLVHICCSVDSHYFLRKLKEIYPRERIIGYFYDPNIHPYSEFLLRFRDVKRSCEELGIKLICGDYDYEAWLAGTKGLENEPEKGARCAYCFDFRVGNAAKIALKMGCRRLTTTLLMSPKKSFTQLQTALNNAVSSVGGGDILEAVAVDFRKNGGTQAQFLLAKNDKLYHQNYCGCIFGLKYGRDAELIDELSEPITGQIQPGSVKARLKLYKKVHRAKKEGVSFELVRRKILNWRLDFGVVRRDGAAVDSAILFGSVFRDGKIKINLISDSAKNRIYKDAKDGLIMLDLRAFNGLCGSGFKSVRELQNSPLSVKKELKIRRKIEERLNDLQGSGLYENGFFENELCENSSHKSVCCKAAPHNVTPRKTALCDPSVHTPRPRKTAQPYIADLSPIIVLDAIEPAKYEIHATTRIFAQMIEDIKY